LQTFGITNLDPTGRILATDYKSGKWILSDTDCTVEHSEEISTWIQDFDSGAVKRSLKSSANEPSSVYTNLQVVTYNSFEALVLNPEKEVLL